METQDSTWPNPDLPGFPLFAQVTSRHVLQDISKGKLILVLWDHEEKHYCTEVGFITPMQMNNSNMKYYAPCFTTSQIADILAHEKGKLDKRLADERARCLEAVAKEQLEDEVSASSDPSDIAYSRAIQHAMSAISNLEQQL